MKNKTLFKTLFILLLLPISLLASCGGGSDDPTEPTKPTTPDKPSTEITIKDGNDLYGVITDQDGKAVSGVVVTDGYTVVTTDQQGVYQMKRNTAAKFVYYTNPEGYEPDNKGFYQTLSSATKRYDFKLSKATGDDTHFYLMLITDPQVRSDKSMVRFRQESVPAMKNFISSATLPVVGWSLGDDVHEQCPQYEKQMHELMTGMGVPFFSAIGNHDYFKVNNSDTEPRSMSDYEKYWGPTWYSFNKGDVHFIAINNVKYSSGTKYNDNGYIDEAQLNWMRKDLAHVSKSKLVIVGYHIPMTYKSANTTRDQMINLLATYPNRLLMAGHTHYMRHSVTNNPIKIEERIHAAVCGAFWWSTINRDGAPNGFSTYEIKGNKIVNNHWVNTNENMPDNIRLTQGDFSDGDYSYGLSSDYVVANVWNWDPQWKVTISEDGGTPVEMEQSLKHSPKITNDAWSDGYLITERKRKASDFQAYNQHLFLYKLKNPNASVVVTATDRYGNKYTQSTFTTDFSECKVDGTTFSPAKKR